MPNVFEISHLPRAHLRAPLSLLPTAWNGIKPYLYSGGSPSAAPTLVAIVTAMLFKLDMTKVPDPTSYSPQYSRH